MRTIATIATGLVLLATALAGQACAQAARGEDRPADDARLHTEAARNPESEAHLDAYLATLPRMRLADGGRWRTYYIHGDTLLTRDDIRRQLPLARDLLRHDPCEGALDAEGRITTELDACLARHPYSSPDGRARYYAFHLIAAEVRRLAIADPALVSRNRRAGTLPQPADPLEGLETLPPPHARTYVLRARCDRRDDCSEVLSLLSGSGRARNAVKPRLAVHASGGVPMYWAEDYRHLRYAVMRTAFKTWRDYQATVTAMREAADDWMKACAECGVVFEHAADLDGLVYVSEFLERARRDRQKQPGGLRFIVTYSEAGGSNLLALAFFPDAPANRRMVFVTPAFLRLPSADAMRRVMRHELGHVLGYRHEQIRLFKTGQMMVGNCYAENMMVEGQDWQAVTHYDALSVMHYNCKSAGLPQLAISAWDIQGHREIYGSRAGAEAPAASFSAGRPVEPAARTGPAPGPASSAPRAGVPTPDRPRGATTGN